MKRFLFFAILPGIFCSAMAQNLVPNPGFEDYNACPDAISLVWYDDLSFPNILNWFAPSTGSSDYFNVCADLFSSASIPDTYIWGHNPSHFCNGMVGFYTMEEGVEYREYVEVQLTEPMIAGTTYYIEFYATTACQNDGFGGYIVATDEVGAYISEEKLLIGTYAALPYAPQIENEEGNYMVDSSAWYKISGLYTASGGEKYMTIGNFKTDAETDYEFVNDEVPTPGSLNGYVFVDDALVVEYTGEIPTDPGDVILCEGETKDLTAPFFALSYAWSTGAETQSITIDEAGTYIVTAEFECNTVTDTFHVSVFPTEETSSYTEDHICTDEFPITLNGEPGFTDYVWNTDQFTPSIVIDEPGLYWVYSSNICTIAKDSFYISALNPESIEIFLGNDTLICSNDPWTMFLDASGAFDSYIWSTGDTTSNITVNEDGNYSVTAENVCGTWADNISITKGPVLFKPDIGDLIILCDDEGFNEVTLTAQEQDCYYNWNTAETTQSITVHEPGTFWVECSNICGRVRDSVGVQLCTYLYMPNAFSPNNDGVNDFYAPVAYPNVDLVSFVIYNRWGELLFETNDITKGWDGNSPEGDVLPMAAYAYVIQYEQYGYVEKLQGSFTLVR